MKSNNLVGSYTGLLQHLFYFVAHESTRLVFTEVGLRECRLNGSYNHFQRTESWQVQNVKTQCMAAVLMERLQRLDQTITDVCHVIGFHKASTVFYLTMAAALMVTRLLKVRTLKAALLLTAR